MKSTEPVIIIGGGLSGLTLAYLLVKKQVQFTLLEASGRLGGRIQTVTGVLETPLELGATWFSELHPSLLALIEELGLQKYPQYSKGKSLFQTNSLEPPQEFFVPQTDAPSYRLAGGTQLLTDTLIQKIKSENIHLNTSISAIEDLGDVLKVESTQGEQFFRNQVFLCLPPQLVSKQIRITPGLPQALNDVISEVQTWMAGSIKFALEYRSPFWREKGFSGMLYSHTGVIAEMYDHTNFEQEKFSFTGFLNGGAATHNQEVRKELILQQLSELLGPEASTPTAYFDKVWMDEFIIGGNHIIQRPHQNNGHPLLQKGYLGDKLYFGGTETSTQSPGYMEGAVISAQINSRLFPSPIAGKFKI
jgi:monoamine oxidase